MRFRWSVFSSLFVSAISAVGIVVASEFIIDVMSMYYGDKYITYVDFARNSLLFILFYKMISGLIDKFIIGVISNHFNDAAGGILLSAVHFLIFIIVLTLFAERLGLNMSGMLTLGGVSGIAIGVAGKNILGNILSGGVLIFDCPFSLGDWVFLPEKNIEGEVISIGWRATRIKGSSSSVIYIPNSAFSSLIVKNNGKSNLSSVSVDFFVDGTDLELIKAIILRASDSFTSNADVSNFEVKGFIERFDRDGVFIKFSVGGVSAKDRVNVTNILNESVLNAIGK